MYRFGTASPLRLPHGISREAKKQPIRIVPLGRAGVIYIPTPLVTTTPLEPLIRAQRSKVHVLCVQPRPWQIYFIQLHVWQGGITSAIYDWLMRPRLMGLSSGSEHWRSAEVADTLQLSPQLSLSIISGSRPVRETQRCNDRGISEWHPVSLVDYPSSIELDSLADLLFSLPQSRNSTWVNAWIPRLTNPSRSFFTPTLLLPIGKINRVHIPGERATFLQSVFTERGCPWWSKILDSRHSHRRWQPTVAKMSFQMSHWSVPLKDEQLCQW